MPNLRDIKKRIGSVQSTKQITRTMEMVAAAKVRRATERVQAANPYAESMREVLSSLASNASGVDNPLLAVREDQRRAAVVAVVSDRGLAGGFNANVLRVVEHYIREKQAEGIEVDVIACGKKAGAYFKYRNIEPVLFFKDLSADPTMDEARQIASYLISRYSAAQIDEAVIVYNHARNVADQDLRKEQVLPVDTSSMEAPGKDGQGDEHAATASFEYEPSAEEVLRRLLPSYVETTVYHALVDSAAGEQGARRKAMQAATDSADEMITAMQRSYNRARQGAITTEISEIVGGAAALEE